MVTITVQISGEVYGISTVEDLTKVQNILTTKFIEQSTNNMEIIDRYFADTPDLEVYDYLSDNHSGLLEYIVDKAVEIETDYQTLEEAGMALSNMQDALDEIYNTARKYT